MSRPLIGITSAYTVVNGLPFNRMYAPNAQAIAQEGGLPVFIPTHLDEDTLRALYATLDGLLLPGGPDVDPAVYGQQRHPLTIHIDDPRDQIELRLTRWAVDDGVPVLGICRGHQVLNVAMGGTLIQDIPSQVPSALQHDINDGMPRDSRLHDVSVSAGSRLKGILGAERVAVNSLHHQAVERLAPGAVVSAAAPDGVIEAIEFPERPFVLSVQWHPEDLFRQDDAMRGLFASFVAAARERQHAHAGAAAD